MFPINTSIARLDGSRLPTTVPFQQQTLSKVWF